MILDIVPALKVDGGSSPTRWSTPTVISMPMAGSCTASRASGDELAYGKQLLARGKVDLSHLDTAVEALCAKLLLTFPECLTKTFEELRKPKLETWNRNKENSRAWLALNMLAEGRTGFRAFNEGPRDNRESTSLRCARRWRKARPGRQNWWKA